MIQLILTIFFSLIFAIITTSKERSDRNRACAFFAKFKSGLSQVVNHLSGNPSSSSTTTTQAQVMSSLVFEKYLSDMMDIAIQQSPKMKTIVVLDNLDRLNIKHLHDAWDNIQLFATYMDQGCGPAKNMWLILPVSQDTVDNLLNEDGNKTQQQALSKLFIIQYRIPKPIKTEWKNSTTHFIEEAFHGISPEEIQCIIALMNCYVTPSRLNNPREQKRVINEHVALSQLYPSVKVGSIAVFLYLRDKYEQLENPESKFESWVTSELARNSSGSMLPRGLDVEFVPAEIAMMTFGVLNPARAQEAMLSGGLLDLTFLQNLDLNTYIANANGSWEIIQDCIVQDGIGLSSRGGKERYIELLKRIDETNPTKEVDSVSKKKAFRSLEFFLEESDWPQVGGSAQVIISMLNESKELGESATKAIAAIKHSATGLQEFNSDRASSWAVEVSNFLQYLITYDAPIDSQAIAVEPGENLYFLLEAIAEQEDRVELAKIIDIGGDEALKDLLHAAVSERPSISNHKVAELIPHLNLLASENEPKASPDYSSYGLSREEGVALFYEIWGWYRYSKAPFCLLYLHNAIANNLFENEIYVKAKNEMEKGAAIALFIHRDLATFNNSACDQYAGMLKEAPEESMLAVKCFAFSPDEKIDDDRLQDIIEAIDNQTTHSLGVYMLNALFENAQVSSECPFWAALRLLSLPETKATMHCLQIWPVCMTLVT